MTAEKNEILFISSYPPRECGIATFTRDLVNAISSQFDETFDLRVCALRSEGMPAHSYPPEVTDELDTADVAHCKAFAADINSRPRLVSVVIEHEFGLFSGQYGESLLSLLNEIRKPVFVCFHTVLPDPPAKMREVVMNISSRAQKIIVLTMHSKNILLRDYHLPDSQVVVIPHGVHKVKPVIDRQALKARYGFQGKIILGTFGLISSNKGIETALEAIAALPDRSNILYLVMGKTHPCVLQNEGEKYREELQRKTAELGITDNVLFINKYLELKELLTYLRLTDIYLFTSRDPMQTVSGTLSYALGSGCTVISTPIPHAKEALSEGSGYIFDFDDSSQLSRIIVDLLASPQKLAATSRQAVIRAQCNTWENVAIQFTNLFKPCTLEDAPLRYNTPSLKLSHFCKMNNEKGMLQFSQAHEPDLASGYTTDDNARALYVLTLYNELYPGDPFIGKYFDIYLRFLESTLQNNGSFLNYVSHEGGYSPQNDRENLDEANARAFVALCRFVYSNEVGPGLRERAHRIVLTCKKYACRLKSPRSIAKVIKGLYYLNLHKKDPVHVFNIHQLSMELLRLHREASSASWDWYESYLTYNNSAIPEGLMYAYLATNEISYKRVALRTFHFLLNKTFTADRIRVISNNGWITRDRPYVHGYGEQPVEIASMIEALYIFYQATADNEYTEKMRTAFSWFLGNNHLGRMVYDSTGGGCHDGVEEFEVNINQGAESTLSYLVSRLTLDKLMVEESILSDILILDKSKSVHNS